MPGACHHLSPLEALWLSPHLSLEGDFPGEESLLLLIPKTPPGPGSPRSVGCIQPILLPLPQSRPELTGNPGPLVHGPSLDARAFPLCSLDKFPSPAAGLRLIIVGPGDRSALPRSCLQIPQNPPQAGTCIHMLLRALAYRVEQWRL